MPRISVSLSMLPAIGKVVGEASVDPAKLEEFRNDPAAALMSAGVPASSLQGLDLPVYVDDETTGNPVVPFRSDADQIAAGRAEYHTLTVTVRAAP